MQSGGDGTLFVLPFSVQIIVTGGSYEDCKEALELASKHGQFSVGFMAFSLDYFYNAVYESLLVKKLTAIVLFL